jgi:glycosyltransferase involved in cell wall biosynthesis
LRIPPRLKKKARVISFLTRRIPTVPIRSPEPNFIFWGRIDRQKGLLHALKIFAAVRETMPDAAFSIIGPDTGYGGILREFCRTVAIDDAVQFPGPKLWEEIQRDASGHSFYLQTSELEGMAMSVMEAMQLGLVPVVTPVGEIARYCSEGQNAIIVRDDERAVQDILEVITSPMTFQRLAGAAQSHWHGQPLYRDSVLSACREIVEEAGCIS